MMDLKLRRKNVKFWTYSKCPSIWVEGEGGRYLSPTIEHKTSYELYPYLFIMLFAIDCSAECIIVLRVPGDKSSHAGLHPLTMKVLTNPYVCSGGLGQ